MKKSVTKHLNTWGGVQKTSLILFFLSAVIFASCSDMLGSQEESSSARGSETGSAVFTGTISVSGALPAALSHAELDSASQSSASRSALPSYNIGNEYYYYVTAAKTDGSDSSNINSLSDLTSFTTTNGVTFALTLTNGSWNIEAGIKKAKSTGTAGANDVSVMSETYPVTISTANPVVSHTFYPKPSQKRSGKVALNISYESGTVNSVAAKCGNESWTVSTSGTPAAIVMDSIASGTYDLSIYFYKNDGNGNSILVYSTVQTINVFDNMTTNTWVSDGSSLINASGVFNLTSTLINQFKRTTFYVGQTAAATSLNIDASDESGTGSVYSPLKTVTKAASIIASSGESSKDYCIFVSGTVTGAQKISGVNGKAKSITIQGYNGLDTNGVPKDALNGGFSWESQGTVLTVSSCTVPITIKNLKITGGCNSAYGGGINIGGTGTSESQKAKLTLESGALITENYIRPDNLKTLGAGIYMCYGKLIMKSGSAITKNKTVKKDTMPNFYSSGGGIGLNDGTEFLMEGGEISENTAYGSGGALCMETNNFSNDILVTLSGGLIRGNECQKGSGGAISNYNGVLNIGGSAHIPYGEAEKSNDIYLAIGKTVTLTSPLTAHSASDQIAITPSNWTPGKTVVQADGTKVTDLTPYQDYFAFTQDGWECKVINEKKSIALDATIYVAESGNNETGKGTKAKPFATIEKAATLMNDKTVDYTIYIVGTVTGAQTIPNTLKNDGNGTYNARSVTIEGVNGLNENGEPKDSLNGTSGNSITRPLNIKSEVPVTITNLKITGGNIAGNGGGIYIDTGTNVALGDGVLVTGNTAASGGGIYNLGKLYLYGSAMVGKKTDTVATSTSGNTATKSGAGIYNQGSLYLGYSSWTSESDNTSAPLTGGVCGNYNEKTENAFGGGIYNKGQIYIASGNVSYNYAHYGAGVCTEGAVAMTGGTIEGNEGDNNYSAGGGIYVYGSNGSFSMSGDAVIKNNRNITYGAGVYILYNSSFEMTGGTIENNTATSTGFGGAVYVHANAADEYCDFKIGADAYIPYGEKKNDIYMTSGWAKIKISSSLEKHSTSNQIMLNLHNNYYSNGNPLLIAESGVTLANEVGKFKVPQYVAGSIRKDYSLDSEGKLLEGLILPSSVDGLASGKTYAVADSSDIEKLSEFSSNGYNFNGVTLKLGADITINSAWTPIGNSTAFSGTFDGNEKTVTFASGAAAEAFFGTVNGTVKNLKVAGSTSVAGIAKKANGASALIENCENSATVTGNSTQEYVAGIVAEVSGATIKGCVNKGAVISNYVATSTVGISLKGAGGITGPIQNGGIIDSCTNTGSVTGLGAGGITSFIDYSCTIRNSQNSGDITSTERYAGGIAGVASGDGNDLSKAPHIDNCFNSGSVTASGTGVSVYAGGIAGQFGGGNIACAKNCLNIGNVSLSPSAASGSKAGALFGTKWNKSTVDFCYYKEGCVDPSFGIGGSTSDTENECIKATQSGSSNAVISAAVTLNGTTYSADSSTVLSLLNAWVSANSTDGLYLVWETDSNHWPKLKAGQ